MTRLEWQNRYRRGTALLVFVVMIPAAMALFLLVLTRVDIATAETKRQQQRVQARLLAESALAVFQTAPDGAGAKGARSLPMEGAVEGAGVWRVEMDKDGKTLVARGEVTGGQPGGGEARVASEIRAEIVPAKQGAETAGLRLIGSSYERTPVGPSRQ